MFEKHNSSICPCFRFVSQQLDDNEGSRKMDPIPNIHGIVKFEINYIFTLDHNEPETGWDELPLAETTKTSFQLQDGRAFKLDIQFR